MAAAGSCGMSCGERQTEWMGSLCTPGEREVYGMPCGRLSDTAPTGVNPTGKMRYSPKVHSGPAGK